jgi:hypothetical protein
MLDACDDDGECAWCSGMRNARAWFTWRDDGAPLRCARVGREGSSPACCFAVTAAVGRDVRAHFLQISYTWVGQLCGNTVSMKVAVSIPDDLVAEVELLAKQVKASRSEIYSRALGEFLGRHAPDCVTEQMNRVVAAVGKQADPFGGRAAPRASWRVEW